jgi:hypothetical protein
MSLANRKDTTISVLFESLVTKTKSILRRRILIDVTLSQTFGCSTVLHIEPSIGCSQLSKVRLPATFQERLESELYFRNMQSRRPACCTNIISVDCYGGFRLQTGYTNRLV